MNNVLKFPEKHPSPQDQKPLPHKTGRGLNTPPDPDEVTVALQHRRQALAIESPELNSDIAEAIAQIYADPSLTNEEVLNKIDEMLRKNETVEGHAATDKLGTLATEHAAANDTPLAPVVNLFDRR